MNDLNIKNICNLCGSINTLESYRYLPHKNEAIIRNNSHCPTCLCQERHRFLYEYIKQNRDIIENKIIVHVSSEVCFRERLAKISRVYHRIDIDPYDKHVQMDIRKMEFESDTIDTFICSHVLEHVEDDDKAIKEIVRVLKKDGTALLLVPIDNREHTEEFNNPNKEDFDHVRNYGYIDFINKLKLYFTSVKRILPKDILNDQVVDLCALSYENGQGIFECKK